MKGQSDTVEELTREVTALRQRVAELESIEAEHTRTEEILRRRTHQLGERVKELNCLYDLSYLIETPTLSLDLILQRAVKLIPLGWQYPETACCRVMVKDQGCYTADFQETPWRQEAEIYLHGQRIGAVEVFYREEKPPADEGPFLKEERALLDAIAERLGRTIERMRTRSALQDTEAKFNALSRQSLYAYAELDLEGKLLFANKHLCEILGYSTEEILGGRFADFVVPEEAERARESFQHMHQQPPQGPQHYTVRTKPGVTKTLAVNSIVLRTNKEPKTVLCLALDVTEQIRSLEQLRRREERYRLLAENATDMIWTADMPGWEETLDTSGDEDSSQLADRLLQGWRFTYVSPSANRLLGYDEHEMQEMQLDVLLTRQSVRMAKRVLMQEMLAEIRDGPDPQRYRTVELQHIQKNRKKLWCEVTTKLLRDNELHVQGVLGITRSIRDRKKAEDTLHSSEARLRQLLENMPDLVIVTDTEGIIQYVNRAHVDKSTEDLVGTDCLECIQPDFHAQCRQLFEHAVETQRVQSHEVVDVCERIWSCRVAPIVARETVRSLMIISTDVTERKSTEEKLRDIEERFQDLAEAVDDVVWTTSLDGSQMLYINPAAERVYGRSCQEFYDNPELWIEAIFPEDREQATQGAKELREQGWKQEEYRITRPDGEVRWLSDRARVICNRDGKPTHIGGLASDITERKQAEQALLDEHGRLRRLLDMHERDRQLVAYEIHDGLAQPITAALMQLEATLRDLGEEYPQSALQRCDDGLTLLRASMHEARRLMGGLRPSVLDEFGVVSAINNLIADSCSDDGPEIEYEHKVEFDRLAVPLETAVFRIAQEGLANALEHSESDRIRVRLVQTGSQLRIEVRDWGVGFSPKTVAPNRFGLEGIRERARLFGGEATIESSLGHGTCVTVELPAVEPASRPAGKTIATE